VPAEPRPRFNLAGFDPNDPTSLSEPVPQVRAGLAQGVAGLRIGFDRRYATENVEADVARTKSVDPFGREADEEWHRLVMNDIHTKPFNFSGSPTLSVPCGFSAEGLPMSVQFVGRRLSEPMLCRVGHAFERATQWHLRQPAV
jgi:Asp-tRNA(Asn)/Glu-tRNA(Gln) amidotransferase A subunit family amidase